MSGKVAWITGATSGFGAATVDRFVEGGWRVVASGRRAERLQRLVERHGAGRVHALAFDIRLTAPGGGVFQANAHRIKRQYVLTSKGKSS